MKEKLIETNMNAKLVKPVLNEATGSQEGWTVQLWNLGEKNLNGRIYTEELAQRLVAENAETLCMDGHENYMAEYSNAMAHAFSPFIQDNFLCVHFEFIDENYEKKIQFCLDHNIPVGVSSVGYGTMNAEGVVTPEDYELVRYFDFVQSPANSTYVAKPVSEPEKEEESVETPEAPAEVVDSSAEENEKQNLIRLALMMHRANTKNEKKGEDYGSSEKN